VARHRSDRLRERVLVGRRHRLRLGFVLSFGYWTTNFVEVQRAMASNSISAAQRAPIIGAFPKMFVPFIVIVPGMLAGVW
jgi:SSS family solute:Na+ symporter